MQIEGSFRAYLIVMVGLLILSSLLFWHALMIVMIFWLVMLGISIRTAIVRIDEPERAIIVRNGQFHHMADGFIFIFPGFEELAGRVSLKPVPHNFFLYQVPDSNGNGMNMELEVTWRINPHITLITEAIKLMLLEDDTQRSRRVEHSLGRVARYVIMGYEAVQLSQAEIRELAMNTLLSATNEYLGQFGLVIESLYWRTGNKDARVTSADTDITIHHARIKALVEDLALIKQHLPDAAPEHILAYQAYIGNFSGGSPLPPPMPWLPMVAPRGTPASNPPPPAAGKP